MARRSQHFVSACGNNRHTVCQSRQLFHGESGSRRLANLSRSGWHSCSSAHNRRHLSSRDSQQSCAKRSVGGRKNGAEENQRNRQRGDGVQGSPNSCHSRCRVDQKPIQKHSSTTTLSTTVDHFCPSPILPTIHWHQCYHVLCTGLVSDSRLRKQCLALLRRHHGSCECPLHSRGHRRGRQSRSPAFVLGSRLPNVHSTGTTYKSRGLFPLGYCDHNVTHCAVACDHSNLMESHGHIRPCFLL